MVWGVFLDSLLLPGLWHYPFRLQSAGGGRLFACPRVGGHLDGQKKVAVDTEARKDKEVRRRDLRFLNWHKRESRDNISSYREETMQKEIFKKQSNTFIKNE